MQGGEGSDFGASGEREMKIVDVKMHNVEIASAPEHLFEHGYVVR